MTFFEEFLLSENQWLHRQRSSLLSDLLDHVFDCLNLNDFLIGEIDAPAFLK